MKMMASYPDMISATRFAIAQPRTPANPNEMPNSKGRAATMRTSVVSEILKSSRQGNPRIKKISPQMIAMSMYL